MIVIGLECNVELLEGNIEKRRKREVVFLYFYDDGVGSIKNDERSIHVFSLALLILLMVLWFVVWSSMAVPP